MSYDYAEIVLGIPRVVNALPASESKCGRVGATIRLAPDEGLSANTSFTEPPLAFVGASLLAKNSQAPRSFRKHALSLTFFASKLAPTAQFFAVADRRPAALQQ
ncbi:hypothetical protein CIB54_13575 [Pseudomonas fluorescens]|uniref:Uncharacterized protein n=1 Tax=Pseudomonas fluorescens TaxID=294 RepID=A0A2N1E603_PSEFL|nr:hypothetical protein CIB54_13575 [Pseudomonas fluorescens]